MAQEEIIHNYGKAKMFINYIRCLDKRRISKKTANILYELLINASFNGDHSFIVEVTLTDFKHLLKSLHVENIIQLLDILSVVNDDGQTLMQYSIFSRIYSNKTDMICFEFSKEFSDAFIGFEG